MKLNGWLKHCRKGSGRFSQNPPKDIANDLPRAKLDDFEVRLEAITVKMGFGMVDHSGEDA
ncbi:hypothetical protein A2U01_0060581 [Trifolium medium]|uniref:Uncharacterized protein n=1 Tax=Trifolium medium TaxID=97028 RepID=A0A392RU87_9FABA|nr:hypothetical protein [Trifolium medium]